MPKKEWQIEFKRTQKINSFGATYYSTDMNFKRVERAYGSSPQGILHKAVYAANTRIVGDIPSLRKTMKEWKPTRFKDQCFKSAAQTAYGFTSFTAKTALKTGLVAETAMLKGGQIATRQIIHHVRTTAFNASRDDASRAVMKAALAVGGISYYRKTARSAKGVNEKAERRHGFHNKKEVRAFKKQYSSAKKELKTALKEKKGLKTALKAKKD